jgi:acetolactate synthase-1/2/3 large subunit
MPNGAQALMKTLADAGVDGVLHQPRHQRDALRGRAGQRAAHARRAVPVRRRGHRRGRRLRTHGRQTRGHLLHLGCGLGNGLANLHNARKGKVPVLNIVGDHATSHVPYDAQLQSDIETVARNVSPGFVRTSRARPICAATRSTPSPPPAACRGRWPR